MLFNHDQQLEESDTSSTTNLSKASLSEPIGRLSLNQNTVHSNSINLNVGADQKENNIDSQLEFFQTALVNLEQYTRNLHSTFTHLFCSSLQLYLSNEPNLSLNSDANHLFNTILESIHQLQQQQQQPPQVYVDAIIRHKANENSKIDHHFAMNIDSMPNQPQIQNDQPNNTSHNMQTMMTQYEPQDKFYLNLESQYADNIKHEATENDVSFGDTLNEHASAEEVKRQDVVQKDDELNLNEFISQYNKHRPVNLQISQDAVTRCFRDNVMDYTDFRDLNHNLKRYGIPAGAVRKLWRFLNPVEMNEDDQDDEDVVVMSIGSYIHIPSNCEYDYFLCGNNDEFIDFEIGENLSVPDYWSDGDH